MNSIRNDKNVTLVGNVKIDQNDSVDSNEHCGITDLTGITIILPKIQREKKKTIVNPVSGENGADATRAYNFHHQGA